MRVSRKAKKTKRNTNYYKKVKKLKASEEIFLTKRTERRIRKTEKH